LGRSSSNSPLENCTWDVIDAPPAVKPICSQWVFVIKHKSDGSIERYKPHLVADGCVYVSHDIQRDAKKLTFSTNTSGT
jgi:hypothetical protein